MGDTLSYVEILRKLRLAYGFLSGFTRGEYLVIRGDSKESAFCFGCLYWFHQWGIPYRTCRFHCCLAAQGGGGGGGGGGGRAGGGGPPPPPPPPAPPPRPRGGPGARRLCIVRVSVGLLGWYRSFFIIGGMDCLCLRLRGGWLWSIVGFALTAIGAFVSAGNGMEIPVSLVA